MGASGYLIEEDGPNCGGTMKIISFIEKRQTYMIEKIVRYCGMCNDTSSQALYLLSLYLPNNRRTRPFSIMVFFTSLAS